MVKQKGNKKAFQKRGLSAGAGPVFHQELGK